MDRLLWIILWINIRWTISDTHIWKKIRQKFAYNYRIIIIATIAIPYEIVCVCACALRMCTFILDTFVDDITGWDLYNVSMQNPFMEQCFQKPASNVTCYIENCLRTECTDSWITSHSIAANEKMNLNSSLISNCWLINTDIFMINYLFTSISWYRSTYTIYIYDHTL